MSNKKKVLKKYAMNFHIILKCYKLWSIIWRFIIKCYIFVRPFFDNEQNLNKKKSWFGYIPKYDDEYIR